MAALREFSEFTKRTSHPMKLDQTEEQIKSTGSPDIN
jgi:hypothetical protein